MCILNGLEQCYLDRLTEDVHIISRQRAGPKKKERQEQVLTKYRKSYWNRWVQKAKMTKQKLNLPFLQIYRAQGRTIDKF